MITNLRRTASLLSGLFLLLVGAGVLGTLIAIAGSRAGFTSTQIGIATAGFYVGFIVGSWAVPAVIGRAGHIRAFAAMASASSAVIILHGLLVDFLAWTILRAVTGFCLVGIYVVVESWLNQQTHSSERGGIFAVYLTVSMLAMACGQALLLVPLDVAALFALVSILFSFGVIPIALTRQAEPTLQAAPPFSLAALYRSSPLGVAGTLAAGLIHSTFYGLAAVFAVRWGLNDQGVAAFVAGAIFGGAVTLFPVGRLSDYVDRRVALVVILLLTALTALGLLASEARPLWTVLAGLLYGAVAFNIYGLSAAHLHDHLEPQQVVAATSGLQTVYGTGSVVGPIVTGWLMARYGAMAFVLWIAAVALATALFALYRMLRAPTVPTDEQGAIILSRVPSVVLANAAPEVESGESVPLVAAEDEGAG